MNRILWSALLLMACSAWMAAQTGSSNPSNSSAGSSATGNTQSNQSGSSNASTPPSSSEIRETSLQGCLQSSSGNYSLTESTGNTHRLQGDEKQLSKHVGQEVELKGYETSAANTPMSGSSSSTATASSAGNSVAKGESPAAFQIHTVTTLSNVCRTPSK